MPDIITEIPIATQTLGSSTSTITFSSIPSTYTDLRITVVGKGTAGGDFLMNFNGDTSTNYSFSRLQADGSTAVSYNNSNQGAIRISAGTYGWQTYPIFNTHDIFSYAGTNYKSVLGTSSEDRNGNGFIVRLAGLWRSTATITSIVLSLSGDTFEPGTTATLYGIL